MSEAPEDEAPQAWWRRAAAHVEPRRFWTMVLASFLVLFIEIIDFSLLNYVSSYLDASIISITLLGISITLLGIAVGGLVGYYAARRAPERGYVWFVGHTARTATRKTELRDG